MSRIVDDANTLGAKSVVFKGGGDPTLKDYLPAAIRLSRSTGLSVGINTNGVRMSADLLNALEESGAWIRFSIDASNSAMYKDGAPSRRLRHCSAKCLSARQAERCYRIVSLANRYQPRS